MDPSDYEWTGEWERTIFKEYWCPTRERWVVCDAPCPDGVPHELSRNVPRHMKVMRLRK